MHRHSARVGVIWVQAWQASRLVGIVKGAGTGSLPRKVEDEDGALKKSRDRPSSKLKVTMFEVLCLHGWGNSR